MAGDKKLLFDDDTYVLITKVFRMKGELVATAGDWDEGERFLEWFGGNRKGRCPKLSDDFQAVSVNKEGIFWWSYKGYSQKLEQDHFALGSGAVAAMCLMAAGATPKEAIEKVSRHDNNTSFETDVIDL
jgi:hypothetical protein